jgi:hypothetical protein
MQSLFKKFADAVTNLVTPRTPPEELKFRWTELQAVNARIQDVRTRLADHAAGSGSGGAASNRLRDGSAINETALWDQLKEHLEGILACLAAEQDMEWAARGGGSGGGSQPPAPFTNARRRSSVGSGASAAGAGGGAGHNHSAGLFQNFNDALLDAADDTDSTTTQQQQQQQQKARAQAMAEHGACLEYFLQQKIMQTICVMGVRQPLGFLFRPSLVRYSLIVQ